MLRSLVRLQQQHPHPVMPIQYFPVRKWLHHTRDTIATVRERGLKRSIKDFLQAHSTKGGVLRGTDSWGNRYYEDVTEDSGKNRWVVFPSKSRVDGSAVPPEWYGWLHNTRDETPIEKPRPAPIYSKSREPNYLSSMGYHADYMPPGALLTVLRGHRPPLPKTDTGAAEEREHQLDGQYEAWHGNPNENPGPEDKPEFITKVERR